jgi:hypothetical protein
LVKNVLSKDCVVEYHGSTTQTHLVMFSSFSFPPEKLTPALVRGQMP